MIRNNTFRKVFCALTMCVLLLPNISLAQEVMTSTVYKIQSDSLNIAGGLSTSANFGVEDTLGEVATGRSSSTNFSLGDAGYQSSEAYFAPPSAPSSISLTPITSDRIEVVWGESRDNFGVEGYYIYRDGVLITTTASFPREFVDSGLTENTEYSYNVSAFDAVGTESLWSSTSTATTLTSSTDTPSSSGRRGGFGQSLVINNFSVVPDYTNVLISFDTSLSVTSKIYWGTDNIYSMGSVSKSSPGLTHSFIIQDLQPRTTYYLKIVLIDSTNTETVYEGTMFNTLSSSMLRLPANVTSFDITPKNESLNLSWLLPNDESIVGVRIVRSESFYPFGVDDGDVVFEDFEATDISLYIDSDVKPDTDYYYTIFTRDIAGNFSSGVIASSKLLVPGETIDKSSPLDRLVDSSNVDPMIDALLIKDFLFIQNGDSLKVEDGGLVTVDANKNLTIALKYYRVPQSLKTIAVTLTTTEENPKSFSFILRANKDKTRFESTVGAIKQSGFYRVRINIIDYKNEGMKRIDGSMAVKDFGMQTPSYLNSKFLMMLAGVIILLAIVAFVFVHLRSRKMATLLLSMFVVISFAFTVRVNAATWNASFNPHFNYQGRLVTPTNVDVPSGDYNMRFSLYTVASGGSPIWTETLTGSNRVTVASGLFSVMLGSTTPITAIDFNDTLYLSVEIGGTGGTPSWDGEMSPRKTLGAVPAAMVAYTLNGYDSSQFVRSDATSTIAVSSSETALTINQTGSGNLFDVKRSGTSQFTVLPSGITFTNATGTNATTTSLFSTTASTSNLYLGTGLGCLQVDSTG
ncbi:MAG: hypothetical protein AB200_01590, partial [Parcubacteria bacterium C7867-005]